MLIGNASVVMASMPANLQSFLIGYSPEGFDPSRYYVREAEDKIINDIIKMKKIADEMARRQIIYRNTTLLYGDSGTGKTEMGKYIAWKLKLPFFYVSFSTTVDSLMGSTSRNIHKIFEFCNSIPCVLMLDEIDCIAFGRSANGSKGPDGELERTTITIMQEFDQLPNHVVLIGATNRPDLIDTALKRRFSIQHEVTNMTDIDLRNLIKQFLKATDTDKYVEDSAIEKLITENNNPGKVMPELIRLIGNQIYEEKKDKVDNESDSDEKLLDLWEVTYTWKTNVAAQTEEDAIAIGRHERSSYSSLRTSEEQYTARRAEFLVPDTKDR